MAILYSDDSGPIVLPLIDSHDPSSKKYYYLNYRPETRSNSFEYIKGMDVVIPTISNGCRYECVSGGISEVAEPIWSTISGKITNDNTVQWKTKPLITRLSTGDAITLSSWSGDVGVVTTSPTIVNGIMTAIRVDAIPSGVNSFSITNTIQILRVSGRIETFDKTIIIPVMQL